MGWFSRRNNEIEAWRGIVQWIPKCRDRGWYHHSKGKKSHQRIERFRSRRIRKIDRILGSTYTYKPGEPKYSGPVKRPARSHSRIICKSGRRFYGWAGAKAEAPSRLESSLANNVPLPTIELWSADSLQVSSRPVRHPNQPLGEKTDRWRSQVPERGQDLTNGLSQVGERW